MTACATGTRLSRQRLSRRRFLAGASAGAALALLGLCQREGQHISARAALAGPAPVQTGTVVAWLLPAAVGMERDVPMTFVQRFEQATPGIKVEVTFEPSGSYEATLRDTLASEYPPDVVHVGAPVVQELGLLGALRDVAPLMRRDAISQDEFFPFLIQQMTDFRTPSRLWAVPKDSAVYVVYYNKALFDRAGIAYPRLDWTFDAFREAVSRLIFDASGHPSTSIHFDRATASSWSMDWGSPITDSPLPGSDLWQNVALGQAGPWFSDDLTRAFLDEPEHIRFLREVLDMRCRDQALLQGAVDAAGGNLWRQGRVGMCIAQYAQSYFYEQEQRTFPYDIVATPAGPLGQFNAATCNGWAIPARATHPDEAWEFVKFLTAPAQQDALATARRWGVARKTSAALLAPAQEPPASFKVALYDPMFGESAVKTRAILYPPFLNQMRAIWDAEFQDLLACGSADVEEAAKRTQPRIQALLDRAWSG